VFKVDIFLIIFNFYLAQFLGKLTISFSLIAFTICVSENFVFFKVDIFSSFELLFGSI
jgi:hypothetical protein